MLINYEVKIDKVNLKKNIIIYVYSVNQDCWIGLTKSENSFQWVDRTRVDYNNWHSGMYV